MSIQIGDILNFAAVVFLVPIGGMLWNIQGRLSKIEGRLASIYHDRRSNLN